MSRRAQTEPRPKPSRIPSTIHKALTERFPRLYLHIAIALLVAVMSGAVFIVRRDYGRQVTYWNEKLTRIGDANQKVLGVWVEERREDANLLASSRSAQLAALNQGRQPSFAAPGWQRQLQIELAVLTHARSYDGAYVLNRRGKVQASSDGATVLPADVVKTVLAGARQSILTISAPQGHPAYSQVAFISPVICAQCSNSQTKEATVIGYAVLLTKPEALTALMSADAGTATGETVLVTLEAGQPVFVSPLRNWPATTSAPSVRPGSPAHLALQQHRPFFGEYRDYRGVRVLAAARFLPGLQWAMVTKVDRSEALAKFRETLYSQTGLTLLRILVIVSVGFAWGRQQRVQRLQADLLAGRQEQEHLRKSEERFWVALQNSPVVVFNQDRQLRYTWVNQPMEPWSKGYLGKTDEEIIGLADGSRLSALKRPVLETGIGVRKEWSFVYCGQERVFDINVQPLRNQQGDIVGITCASTDITEHKRAEERLREYEKLVEGVEEMIVVLDSEYRYLIANRAFLNYRGLQREQLIGRRVADVTNPGVFENVLKPKLDECLQGKIVTFEMKYTYPKLGERDILLSYFPIEGLKGVDRVACVVEDITARKRTEERLCEYEKVVEGVEEMIVVVDSDYRYLIANRAFLNYRGLQRQDLIGRSVAEVLHPGVFETFLKAKLDECLQGRTVSFEMTYDYPQLGVRDLHVSYFPVEGRSGVDRVACVLHDVTDRKRAEQALRQSETRYRLLFEHNPAGMFRSTLEGTLLEANDAFARMFGYACRQELLLFPNQHFYMRPEERAPLMDRLRQERALKDHEFCGRHRDGSPVWVLANLALVAGENGAPYLLEGTFIDITTRKRAEEALHRSEAQLRAFVENAPYGMFRYAKDRFLTANPALVRMLGYNTEAEVVALKVSSDVFSESAASHDLLELAGQRFSFGPLEAQWKRRDGTALLVRLSGRTIPGPQNGHLIVEAIVEDITQQRILDQHLRQADKMEALGRMAGGLAHDFNNLLLGITLNLEHLLERVGSTDHLLRQELEETLQAAQNAGVITRQLLVFGRKRPLQQEPVNLNDVVIKSQRLVSHLAGESIYVNLRLAEQLGMVMADAVQLQQVLLNLAANARDAMPAGGQLTLRTAEVELENAPPDEYFSAPPKPAHYVVLEVSDTGTGISKEAVSHMFEPFFTTKAEGSGLGLSASYGIATQSAGYISLRSEPGRGTTIRFYLPRAQEASAARMPA